MTYHESTQRRDLFWLGSQAAISAFTAGAIGGGELFAQRKPQPPPGSRKPPYRNAGGQCVRQWLAHEARLAGAEISLEPFSLSRVDPESCYLRIGEHRIEAVPLFDGGFTRPEGVEGAIGPLGSEAEIALVESETAETCRVFEPSATRRGRGGAPQQA